MTQPLLVAVTILVLLQAVCIVVLLIQRVSRAPVAAADRQSEPIPLAGEAARVTVERYTAATAAGGVGVWEWNLESSQVYVDSNLEAILGFAPGEMTSRPEDWASRVHPEDLPSVSARIEECVAGRDDQYQIEHRMVHRDGSTRWFLSRGKVLRRSSRAPHRIVGTKVDITARKRAEEATIENRAMLEAANGKLQALAGRLIASQEIERARIARDLHDDISQQVAGLSIGLSGLKRRLADAADLQRDVSALQQRTLTLAEDIRHLSHELHPSVLQHVGLVPSLAAHCAELEKREGLTVAFKADGDFEATTGDSALCLYRVAQEALRNVVTHAGARHAVVGLRRNGDLAELTISDDGAGFDINHARTSQKGLGLISINERVKLAGGSVSIVTEVNKGTRVRVILSL